MAISAARSAVAALKFLYADTLGCPGRVTGLRSRKRPRKLPRHVTEEKVERPSA